MRELEQYLNSADQPVWKWQTRDVLELSSQRWRDIPWQHKLSVHGRELGDTAILVVTGGEINSLDEDEARALSKQSGLPVATLYDIPNQPLFDGLGEDDLIAFTFIQYLATEEPDWPLLLPMVKSVLSAMDALEAECGFKKYVVTGISKRGWTSWLAGASGDPRIAGIAPMSIDHLNIPRQMNHQLATWGEYSEQIRSYTELDLPKQLDSPEGLHLNSIVDPYAYRDKIKAPILVVNGSNDRYWQVDALNLYWDDLPDPKWARVIANVEHVLDKIEKNAVLASFARHLANGKAPATPRFQWHRDSHVISISPLAVGEPLLSRLWAAYSGDYEFRDKVWSIVVEGSGTLTATLPSGGRMAIMAEWRYRYSGIEYSLTTPVEVLSQSER